MLISVCFGSVWTLNAEELLLSPEHFRQPLKENAVLSSTWGSAARFELTNMPSSLARTWSGMHGKRIFCLLPVAAWCVNICMRMNLMPSFVCLKHFYYHMYVLVFKFPAPRRIPEVESTSTQTQGQKRSFKSYLAHLCTVVSVRRL